MSTVIHQMLVKRTQRNLWGLLTIDYWSNRQSRSYIHITVHFISD